MTLLLLLLACRADPGEPNYPDPTVVGSDTEDDGYLDGPDPYVDGAARLSLSLFYEGDFTDEILVDDVTNFYYIYDGTYTTYVDDEEYLEGYSSDVLVHTGGGYWGGGVTLSTAVDLSEWTTMRVSFLSEGATFADFEVHLAGGGTEAIVDASTYGFVNDGDWYSLVIPLSDFSDGGADMSSVTAPFVLIGSAGTAGEELWVDDLYLTQE